MRIYEPRPGAPLRWDFREEGKRRRPEVQPLMYVRREPDEPTDPVLVARAKELLQQKAAALTLEPRRPPAQPQALTVGRAYELYFDPRRKALPPSPEARKNHTASRDFFLEELGEDTVWDDVVPNDVWSALLRLRESGRVATAVKRLQNLRTVYRWLRDMMGYDTLRDPTRGLLVEKLQEGYTPRRPR